MKKRNRWIIGLLTALIVLMIVMPLALIPSDFEGTDAAGKTVIEEVDPSFLPPEYPPLIEIIIGGKLPAETESFLFAFQAAMGAGVLGYGFGVLRMRKKMESQDASY